MGSRFAAQPIVTAYDIASLVAMAWRGELRVPRFRRDFQWRHRHVIDLFDSIVRGYPIGTLLLWRRRAAAQQLRLGALTIEAPATDRALWVLDGQQRITSLANALHPDGWRDERFRIAYDPQLEKFVALPAQSVEDPLKVPLPVLFNPEKLLDWIRTHPAGADDIQRLFRIVPRLLQYQVPAYEVEHEDENVLIQIVDRANHGGRQWSRAELFSALARVDESRREVRSVEGIAAGIDEDLEFGLINQDAVYEAVLAARTQGLDRERGEDSDAHWGDFPEKERDTAYQLGEQALRRAVRFLQDVAGVPHVTMLPHLYVLVVLTALFARHPDPDPVNLRLLRRWLWRAVAAGPEVVDGKAIGAARTSCRAIDADDLGSSIGALLRLVESADRSLPDLRSFRSVHAGTKTVLCAWWSNGPRSLLGGERLDRGDLAEVLGSAPTVAAAVRHIVARKEVPEECRQWAANRVLLPDPGMKTSAVIRNITARSGDIDEEQWHATLRSHLLDESLVRLLREGSVAEFLAARQEQVHRQLIMFLRGMCEWEFEDTPPLSDLVVEDLSEGDDEPG